MTLPLPFRFDIVKTYPPRGPLQQFRTGTSTTFTCFRCTQSKVSKLVSTLNGDTEHLLCNGCYGYLLSVWDLQVDQRDDDERDQALLGLLARAITVAEVESGRALLRAREARIDALSNEAQTLLATAEAVRKGMVSWHATALDWSAAALPLCKAMEIEVVRQVIHPLAAATRGADLSEDASNPKLRPVVRFCQGDPTHLMLGPVTQFLRAIGELGSRSSSMADAVRRVTKAWPNADWLFAAAGLPQLLDNLRKDFRNRVAHTEILSESDFNECYELVIGDTGMLWHLLVSTSPRTK